MSSILTNMSAMTAVQNLAATQKSLADVQNEISTGLKVSSAKDNAAYYSIATTMRTNIGNLSAVSDSLNLGSSVVSTATSAVTNVTSVLQSISKALVSASQPGTDLDAVNTQIDALRNQLASTISSASFNGVNLLDGSNATSVNFVAGVTGSGANTTIQSMTIDTSGLNFSNANYAGGDTKVLAKSNTATLLAAATVANTTAQSDLKTAQTNNTTTLNKLTNAITAATTADLTDQSSTAFKAIFGDGATYDSTSKTVSNIVAGSLASSLVGADGTVTLNTSGTNAAIASYAAGASASGTLGILYGASATNSTIASGATSDSVAGKAATASSALTTATTNDTNAGAALNASETTIANSSLFAISRISLSSAGGGTSQATIQAYIQQVGSAISAVNTASETLGAAASNIDLQSTYTSTLSDSLTTGVGSLVDADMNEASTRLNALQTQQQLGVQALSVANQNSQLILKLFQ